MTTTDTLARYHLLGHTGLRVSPLALGAMTFGQEDWGADEETSRAIFRRYLEAGGNFVDTANVYGNGRSEELLGTFLRETGARDQLVLATKCTGATAPGNPNAAGNGRKNMLASLDASLRRLQTDYVDLYWLHAWDTVTPVEEVMATFDALVRGGKVRAVGLSNVPAWYATKARMLAQARGWEPIAALQLEYSLIERAIEWEHVPAALDLGMGVVPWSPLANGFLTGKYTRATEGPVGPGRLGAFPFKGGRFLQRSHTDQHWDVLDALVAVATERGRTPAQVALNWVARRPGIVSTLIGARNLAQLEDNLAALEFDLSPEDIARLDDAGQPAAHPPYTVFDPALIRQFSFAGTQVLREPRWFRG